MEVLRYVAGSRQVGEGVSLAGPSEKSTVIVIASAPLGWPSEGDGSSLPEVRYVGMDAIMADQRYLEPLEAIARLREQGAFISVSHPFDRRRHGWRLADLERITPLVDAVEVFNSRCQVNLLNEQAQAYAQKHGLAGTVGSDAHTMREVGRSRLVFEAFESADELREVIRRGRAQTQLSSPFIHLSSTYARMVKEIRRRRENSSN